MSFETLGLGPNLLRSIGEVGYSDPTPIQEAAIPLIIEGNDLIGIAQTGTGKTAAFTLPMLETLERLTSDPSRRGKTRALVLSPTRELVVQIHDNVSAYARHLSLKVATVYGGVNEAPQKKALRAGVDLVIATPGRLMDLMGQGCADFSGIEFFVLDEADRMLDMGFLPNIRKIVKNLPKKGKQTLLFSATLSRDIEKLTKEFLYRPKTVEIGKRSNPADTVRQCIHEVPNSSKVSLLKHLLEDNDLYSVLVFTRTKHGADRVAGQLAKSKIPTAAIHSNRSQNQRARALQDFKDGKTRVLVATDIAARGIDVEGITHVINFDFPPNAEDYIHRIGRTGRANSAGEAISFITSEDQGTLRIVERKMRKSIYRKRVTGFNISRSSDSSKSSNSRHKKGGGGGSSFRPNQSAKGGRSAGGKQRRNFGQRRSSGK
jgi:ATP-dependent RNA helicase RhlE